MIAAILPLSGQANEIGKKQLEIHAPSSVNEGGSFEVYVTVWNQSQPLSGVKVTFMGVVYITNGTLHLTAPLVNHTMVQMIYAEKQGYVSAKQPITILDIPDQPRLILQAPAEVWGGDGFSVFVTDSQYHPISGARVTFFVYLGGNQSGNQSGNQTDYIEIHYTVNGSAYFYAPYVEETTIGSLTAEKTGYLSDVTSIRIRQRPEQLIIYAPYVVLEGETFSVYVTDSSGAPIDQAFVMLLVFEQGHNYTYSTYTSNGTALLIAPLVDQTVGGWIRADKEGYSSDEVPVIIQNNAPELQIKIDAPSEIPEGEMFKVIVTANGAPLMNATVEFLNSTVSTNEEGCAVLIAPFVEQDLNVPIYAFKEGYVSGEAWITILNVK